MGPRVSLRSSNRGPPMSAWGQKRHSQPRRCGSECPLRPDSGHASTHAASDDLVSQRRLAAPQAVEILKQEVDDVVLVAAGLAGGVRRDQRVVERP